MHVMIDLETMSLQKNAAIISIGAVQFGNGGTQQTFYAQIKPNNWFGHLDPDTIAWWMMKEEAARKAATEGTVLLKDALTQFSDWLNGITLEGIWGNGADFDNAVLENCYKAFGIEKPWTHKQSRCYRTLKELFTQIPFERCGVHHTALDDAMSQAEHAYKILKSGGILS